MKKSYLFLIGALVLILIGAGIYFYVRQSQSENFVAEKQSTTTPVVEGSGSLPSSTVTAPLQQEDKSKTVIGTSVQGTSIVAYHYGSGSKELLFVGGIHGGYEWNTALVAYTLMDYLKQYPAEIPADVTVTIIPVLNPDGLKKVVGTADVFKATDVTASLDAQIAGRFNANTVDLNRNFECDWQASGMWQTTKVSGGSAAFSEPESQAIKQYVANHKIAAAVVWFSAEGGVYSSNCHNGVSSETSALTELYAKASGYPAHEDFDFYLITGDMTNWLAKNNVPAISVLLTTHQDVEWTKNLAGIKAVLGHYAQ